MTENKMIEELTNEQKALLEVYKDKWLNIGLSTNDFSFEEAKEISDYYYEKILNITKVPVIIMDSPYTAWIAVCLLSRDQVWSQVRDQVQSQVWSQVRDQVQSQVRDQVQSQVWSQVRSQVWSQVRSQVQSQVWSQVGSQVRDFIYPYLGGSFDASYFSFYNYIKEVLNFDFGEKWEWYESTSKLGLIYPLKNFCVISKKPVEIHFNGEGKLHADGKPAIKYADGFSVWVLNGVRVPQYLAETSAGSLDINFFKEEKNADIKAEFIRKYGIERMVSLGKEIDSWENHPKAKNYEWYKRSQYKIIDMSPIFTTYTYLPYLYMKNQTVPGVYHLECVFNPNTSTQPGTIIEGLKVRMNGVDPESVEITAIA